MILTYNVGAFCKRTVLRVKNDIGGAFSKRAYRGWWNAKLTLIGIASETQQIRIIHQIPHTE